MWIHKNECPATPKNHAKINFENQHFYSNILLLPRLSSNLEGIKTWQISTNYTYLLVPAALDRKWTGPWTFSHCWHVFNFSKDSTNCQFVNKLISAVPSEYHERQYFSKLKTFVYSTISSKFVKIIKFCVKKRFFVRNLLVH